MYPTSNARERILLFGKEGTGKTHAWNTWAAWYRRTNTPGRFYVLDTDNAVDRMSDAYGEDYRENVQASDAYVWDDYITLVNDAYTSGTKDDILVVDLIDKAWDAVQDYYIEQTTGKEPGAWFLEFRKEGGKGSPLAGEFGINWQIINKLYSAFIGKVIRFPGHVICCAPSDTIQQPDSSGKGGDSKDILETFGRFGVKAKGQKALGHQFHTVLLTTSKQDGWGITTVKDRSRERVKNQTMTDFVLNYLRPIGGWEIGTGTPES